MAKRVKGQLDARTTAAARLAAFEAFLHSSLFSPGVKPELVAPADQKGKFCLPHGGRDLCRGG